MEHYFVDASGKYVGTHAGLQRPDELFVDREGAVILVDGAPVVMTVPPYEPPAGAPPGAIEVPFPPADGRDVWDGAKYITHVEEPKPLSLDALAQILMAKGVLTDSDLKEKTK
jgi:hypothetical protein